MGNIGGEENAKDDFEETRMTRMSKRKQIRAENDLRIKTTSVHGVPVLLRE